MDFLTLAQTDTVAAAKTLLGSALTLDETFLGTIVETEAYLFPEDAANHSFEEHHTSRNHSMYLNAGHWYIYQIYGYQMLNFITRPENVAEGILIRALELPSGEPLANGPGKLTRLFGIGKTFDGQEQTRLKVLPHLVPLSISSRARIGINCPEPWQSEKLNFYVTGNSAVSKVKKNEIQTQSWK